MLSLALGLFILL